MLPLSYETIEKAKKVNLVSFLLSVGEPLKKEGKNYRLKKHDSLTINAENNLWKWNSRDIGGKNAIDYLMKVENQTFLAAVNELLNNTQVVLNKPQIIEKVPFILPKPFDNNRRVFSYLTKTRCIDPRIVNHFIKVKDIYEDAKYHNVIFVGRDENGKACAAFKRSTVTLNKVDAEGNEYNHRWDVESSDKRYGFRYIGPSDRIFIFEAPIDLLSFITIREFTQKGRWKEDSYLSLACVADCALAWLLSQKKEGEKYKRIVSCLDNDKGGRKNTTDILNKYKDSYKVSDKPPKLGKDYNDYLKILKFKGDKSHG